MLEQLIALLGWKEKYEFDIPEKKRFFKSKKNLEKVATYKNIHEFQKKKIFSKDARKMQALAII